MALDFLSSDYDL